MSENIELVNHIVTEILSINNGMDSMKTGDRLAIKQNSGAGEIDLGGRNRASLVDCVRKAMDSYEAPGVSGEAIQAGSADGFDYPVIIVRTTEADLRDGPSVVYKPVTVTLR